MTRVVVRIDLLALAHNLRRLRCLAPRSKILAMVKANAYGHGLLTIAKALTEYVEGFGVSCLEEALCLRQAGLKNRIVLMGGLFSGCEFQSLVDNRLDMIVHDERQLNFIIKRPLPYPVNIWLKINTGMNRLGFPIKALEDILKKVSRCSWVRLVCVMTHFANADKPNDEMTLSQIKCFRKAMNNHRLFEQSLANSAAILAYPEFNADWIRPGLMLYGVSPFFNSSGSQHQLKPVMTLTSQIISVTQLETGDRVGYGGMWIAPYPMKIGVVGIGYGDGYPHSAGNGTPVLVNGKLVELIGQVSMDMLTVDLTNQPDAKIGDPVLLWGAELPIEQVAESTSSFSYELLCGVNRGKLVRAHIEEKNAG